MPNAARPSGLGVPSWRQPPGSGPVVPMAGVDTGCPLGPVRLEATGTSLRVNPGMRCPAASRVMPEGNVAWLLMCRLWSGSLFATALRAAFPLLSGSR
eukprot:9534909-Heterocapsa_arctica.AAC.1